MCLCQLDNNEDDSSSITPKRPLLSRDRSATALVDVSPLADRNSRPEPVLRAPLPTTPLAAVKHDQSPVSSVENCMFVISPPQSRRSAAIDEDDQSYVPAYIHKKAKPAPSTTWKTTYHVHKLLNAAKVSTETEAPTLDTQPSQFCSEETSFSVSRRLSLSSDILLSTVDSSACSLQPIVRKHRRQTGARVHHLVQLVIHACGIHG